MIEYVLFGAGAVLWGRALSVHSPKLVRMIWRGLSDESFVALKDLAELEAARSRDRLDTPNLEELLEIGEAVTARHEERLFIACPTAFWLEPTRWTRPSWPAAPVEADLSWDRSAGDLALAHAALPDDLRRKIERAWVGGSISSKRTFDRYQGVAHCASCGGPRMGTFRGVDVCSRDACAFAIIQRGKYNGR